MRRLWNALIPKTIRSQMTALVLVALLIVISGGQSFENATLLFGLPDIENMTVEARTVATLLRDTPPAQREAMLVRAQAGGLNMQLQPLSVIEALPPSPALLDSKLGQLIDTLFPPDGEPPIGGWRMVMDGRRIIAVPVDAQTALVYSGMPNSLLTSQFLIPSSYYFLAAVVLLCLFSTFAIRAITAPLKRISEAAEAAHNNDSGQIFEERGSIEIVGLARALNGMRSRIRGMAQARSRMLRGVGHDLRTPLTRLRLRAERMEEGPLRSALLSDVGRIDDLIRETLNYLRGDVSTEPLQRVDIASILQTVCAEFSDVGFDVSYEGRNRLVGYCKPQALTRAVTNLCDNSVKFAGRVVVDLTATPQAVEICVRDDGPGIPEAARCRVFEPFFKMDPARVEKAKQGFGLGLSIVADVVEAHGGSVTLENRQPHGLLVRMILPNPAVTTQPLRESVG